MKNSLRSKKILVSLPFKAKKVFKNVIKNQTIVIFYADKLKICDSQKKPQQ